MAKKIWTVVVFAITVLIANNTAAWVEPARLRCEYRANPEGLDVCFPRLSWILKAKERGQIQTAYRIIVSSSTKKLRADIGDLWDSGKVNSEQSVHVEYAGKPLQSRMRCYWKVRIWDKKGVRSSWSPPAQWSMGLISQSDWKARWIGYDTSMLNKHPTLHLPPSPYLRKSFIIKRNIRRATVYVSALGLFELYINGRRVGHDYFTPGWTNYRKRVYYLTYDVTTLLKNGGNAIGAILANGWYAGYVGFAPRHKESAKVRAFYGDTPALLVQLEVEYDNGEVKSIFTDKTWKASTGPILEADILMGETYDARLEMKGWSRPMFDDRSWRQAKLIKVTVGQIESYPSDPVRISQKIRPIEITEQRPGVFVFNMGQNFAGRVRLKVKGKRGTRIVLRFAEMLHPDGTIMTENLRSARCTDIYILKGTGVEEVWEPRFTYHGFQYVEVTGFPEEPDLDDITGIVMHSAMPLVGTFKCSDKMVNKLYDNIVWSQLSNFFEIPTDCPQRDERLGWTGDAQLFIRSATYNMDVATFFAKWLVNLEDDQRPSGAFPDFAPMPFLLFEPSPGWMDAGVICPYTLYKVYGDTRVIKRQYKAMTKFMDFLQRTSNAYLRVPQYHCWGDWLSLDNKIPESLIATAYFAYDAKLMVEMAAAIGQTEDAQKYYRLFDNIKAAFNRAFVMENGRILGDTQSGYALAINMGFLSNQFNKLAGQHLLDLIKKRNWHLATGFLGMKHLLQALTNQGYKDVAYRLLTNKTYPSWGYSIKNGATTIWERWNSYTEENGFENPEMNSFNHYAFGSVCEWMFAFMAGIDTDGPGYKRIKIRPYTSGEITSIEASYNSIRGPIETKWSVHNGNFQLDITIPANTSATVYIPAKYHGNITESGIKASQAIAVNFLRMEGKTAVYTVGSGHYRFISFQPQLDFLECIQ